MNRTPLEVRKQFGKRLERLRLAKDWDYKDVAPHVGVTHWAVRKYEEGKREPKLWQLIKLSELFNVTVSFLVVGRHDASEVIELRRVNQRPKRA